MTAGVWMTSLLHFTELRELSLSKLLMTTYYVPATLQNAGTSGVRRPCLSCNDGSPLWHIWWVCPSDRRSLPLEGQNKHPLWVELGPCGLMCVHPPDRPGVGISDQGNGMSQHRGMGNRGSPCDLHGCDPQGVPVGQVGWELVRWQCGTQAGCACGFGSWPGVLSSGCVPTGNSQSIWWVDERTEQSIELACNF